MAGLFLIIFGVIFLFYSAMGFLTDILPASSGFIVVISGMLFIVMLIAIPISRNNSRVAVEEVKIFQKTRLISEAKVQYEDIHNQNTKILDWDEKGQKWYNNKWYYHPSTRNVDYIH